MGVTNCGVDPYGGTSLGAIGDATFDRGDMFVEEYGATRRYFTGEWFKDSHKLVLWYGEEARVVLIAEMYARHVVRVRLDEPGDAAVSLLCDVERDLGELDVGSHFVETPAGPVYEFGNGVVAFDPDGRIRWTVHLVGMEWSVAEIERDIVRFTSCFDETRRYRLDDGRQLAD